VTPAARAVVMASATKLAAPLAEPAEPRRIGVPAMTAAAIGVEIVANTRMQSMHPGVAVLRALLGIPIHAADRENQRPQSASESAPGNNGALRDRPISISRATASS
jgi:hypothetical protein